MQLDTLLSGGAVPAFRHEDRDPLPHGRGTKALDFTALSTCSVL